MKHYVFFIVAYIIIISIIAVSLTIKDKKAAQNNKWRIPESTLMTVGLLGGATAMLITAKIIRHKTKHLKFMIGLPVQIALHIIILLLSLIYF